MGANDRDPSGSGTLKPRWQSGPREPMYWTNVPADVIVDLVVGASKVGAYVGFGSSTDASALLLYIKNGRINERIPLESYQEAKDFAQWVIAHWLAP